jgi:hypothetical protein
MWPTLRSPPGQFGGGDIATEEAFFAGQVPATGSFLRALIATGVILVDEDGVLRGRRFHEARTQRQLRGGDVP